MEKKRLFAEWGYDIMDSDELKKDYERQALDKYVKGEYELGLLGSVDTR